MCKYATLRQTNTLNVYLLLESFELLLAKSLVFQVTPIFDNLSNDSPSNEQGKARS